MILFKNITMFLAAIFPHGIMEFPSFIIASSAGLKLELIFKTLRQTIYITFGLLPLFIIAVIIEAFIAPLIMSVYGW